MSELKIEFLKNLRKESIHHKDKRADFVWKKMISIATLFGLGSSTLTNFNFSILLFVVPVIAIAMDVFIFAEDYKVKRIGAFFGKYSHVSSAEQVWENFVQKNREPVAVYASVVLTLITIVASGSLLYKQISQGANTLESINLDTVTFWCWISIISILFGTVYLYYRWRLNKLSNVDLNE